MLLVHLMTDFRLDSTGQTNCNEIFFSESDYRCL